MNVHLLSTAVLNKPEWYGSYFRRLQAGKISCRSYENYLRCAYTNMCPIFGRNLRKPSVMEGSTMNGLSRIQYTMSYLEAVG
jgi:hypothetical protein